MDKFKVENLENATHVVVRGEEEIIYCFKDAEEFWDFMENEKEVDLIHEKVPALHPLVFRTMKAVEEEEIVAVVKQLQECLLNMDREKKFKKEDLACVVSRNSKGVLTLKFDAILMKHETLRDDVYPKVKIDWKLSKKFYDDEWYRINPEHGHYYFPRFDCEEYEDLMEGLRDLKIRHQECDVDKEIKEAKKEAKYVVTKEQPKGDIVKSNYTVGQLINDYDQKSFRNANEVDQFRSDLQKCVAKIIKGNQYVVRNGSDDYEICSDKEFEAKLKGCKCFRVEDDKKIKMKMMELVHEKKKDIMYAKMFFCPKIGNREEGKDQHFNTFTGFKYKPTDYNDSDLSELLKFIKEVMANENGEVYEYLLDWMAFTLQNPASLIGVALAFISEEGAGKNTFWDFFGKMIIGVRYYLLTGIDNVACRFNDALEGKFLSVVNEATITEEHMVKLKMYITDSPVQIEQKYKGIREMDNFLHWVFLTNNERLFQKLNENQRRFLILRMSDKYAGKDAGKFWEFFRPLLNQDLANKFAKFLLERKVTRDIRKFPETEFYKEMVEEVKEEKSGGAREFFFEGPFDELFPAGKVQATKLRTDLNRWLKSKGLKEVTAPQLTKICEELKIGKKKEKDGTFYEKAKQREK